MKRFIIVSVGIILFCVSCNFLNKKQDFPPSNPDKKAEKENKAPPPGYGNRVVKE